MPLPPWLCYNRAAVDFSAKKEVASDEWRVAREEKLPGLHKQQGNEDASRYCPVCSQRLESRRCMLICPVCGYYMSCADYY